MLQHLNAVRTVNAGPGELATEEHYVGTIDTNTQLPNLVLAIEEPELYQHPSRQRHFASVLLNLANGTIPGVAENTQVIYGTHSPLFVGLDRFDQIRVLRKVSQGDSKPKATQLKRANMDSVAKELWQASGKQGNMFTASTLRPRLQSIMTPLMGEGFFADVVVLVEGEDDRAAVLGYARARKYDFDSLGITIIPCSGKSSLDRPIVIFRQLGILVYVIWDGDYGAHNAKGEDNAYLLRLLNMPEEEWPDYVDDTSACFKVNLEKTMEEALGNHLFETWLGEAQAAFGITKKKQALKNPSVVEYIATKAVEAGKTVKALEQIIANIVALNNVPNHL